MPAVVHALKLPRCEEEGGYLELLWAELQEAFDKPTWCGCTLTARAITALKIWQNAK